MLHFRRVFCLSSLHAGSGTTTTYAPQGQGPLLLYTGQEHDVDPVNSEQCLAPPVRDPGHVQADFLMQLHWLLDPGVSEIGKNKGGELCG